MTIKDYFELVSQEDGEFKYELTIEDVPTGKYTVTETNSTFDGYELVSQTGGGETNVVKGEEAITNFVDEYEMVTGSLEIEKTFKDAPSNLDATKITFTVEGPELFNNGEDLTITYDQFTDGKYVINDAPIGEYTVTETNNEENLEDGNYRYTFNSGASTTTGSALVLKDETVTVTLVNVYDEEEILGSLTVSKTLGMDDESDIPAESGLIEKTFKISVRNSDTELYLADDKGSYSEAPVWFDITAGTPITFNNIKLGNYVVSEDVTDAADVDSSIIFEASASTTENEAVLSVDAPNGNVTIDNIYKHYVEEIIEYPVYFSKEDSLSGAEVEGASIELYSGDKAEGTPIATWVSTLTSHVENLEVGTYTFKETVAPTGYDIVETAITFTVEKDENSDKGYNVKLIDLSDEVCYQREDGTLVLKDDPMLGILKVVKVVETNTGNKPVVDGFNVTVKNLKNNKYVQNENGELGDEAKDIFVPIDSTGVGSVEITGLRPAKYLVVEKEDGKSVKGFIYDANGSVAELEAEISLTESGASTTEIELANKYVEDIGFLEITKNITGDTPDKTEFKVAVKNTEGQYLTADGKLVDSETYISVKAGETFTIANVPSDKYTVSEDLEDAGNVTGYHFNSEDSVVAMDATVTQGSTAKVELTNDYSKISTGKIYVHVTEENSGKDVPGVTVKVINEETGETLEYKTNSKGEIVDENGNTPEVPAGDYKVVITDVPDGYKVKTGETGNVTVPENEIGKHEAVINTERGGIIITVYDEKTGEVVPNAKVKITTPDGKTATFVTDSEGQVKEYAKQDEFGNYTQKPGEFVYEVTEVPEGYKVTLNKKQSGTVEPNKLTSLIAKIAAEDETVTQTTIPTNQNETKPQTQENVTGGKTEPTTEAKTEETVKQEPTTEAKKDATVKTEPSTEVQKTTTVKTEPSTQAQNTTPKKPASSVQTGDSAPIVAIVIIMLVALAGIGFIVIRKKKADR
ncbi:MAG: LPXTG cell wall anchor domain-containing protein, partial [Eubacterium sp.]|nr:LPXTG cell wall anchor domain-containing protein [Eubacterium sp.]